MQILVTGAGSELGQAVLRAVVARAALQRRDGSLAPVRRILGVDRKQPPALFLEDRVEYVRGDFEQPRFLARVMGAATDSVFHLAARDASLGGDAGADGLELALQRSVDATRALIHACRLQAHAPRVVYAGLRDLRSTAAAVPQTTDEVCIDICESLLVEAARRGLIDLRSVRLRLPAGVATPASMAACAADALLQAHELPGAPASVQILEVDGDAIAQPIGG